MDTWKHTQPTPLRSHQRPVSAPGPRSLQPQAPPPLRRGQCQHNRQWRAATGSACWRSSGAPLPPLRMHSVRVRRTQWRSRPHHLGMARATGRGCLMAQGQQRQRALGCLMAQGHRQGLCLGWARWMGQERGWACSTPQDWWTVQGQRTRRAAAHWRSWAEEAWSPSPRQAGTPWAAGARWTGWRQGWHPHWDQQTRQQQQRARALGRRWHQGQGCWTQTHPRWRRWWRRGRGQGCGSG